MNRLIEEAGQQQDFRDVSHKVGVVYSMSYSRATIAIYDYDREAAGGLPKGGFLIAAKPTGDEAFILLRILGETRLPAAAANDITREQAVETTANDRPWPEALDAWTKDRLSLHGVECRILGTFLIDDQGKRKFAEDTDNYYAVSDLMVWKPDVATLDLIVNHIHRSNPIVVEDAEAPVGLTRFAAAERETTPAQVNLNVTDLLRRRTVYFGMSRSGKSNAMKVTAEQIYRLRAINPDFRIGQLIFDQNGEYAQDNPDDGPGLHRVHEAINLERDGEVETFGLFFVPSDPKRKMMKINFYGNELPSAWEPAAIEDALEQLLEGRQIVQAAMAEATAIYTRAFRDVDLSIPEETIHEFGPRIRYRRSILAYQAALRAAGLEPPDWRPNIDRLFPEELVAIMKGNDNYKSAAEIIEGAKSSGGRINWTQLTDLFRTLRQFIADNESGYEEFNEENKKKDSTSGDDWAEPRLTNLLEIFRYDNGPRSFQKVQAQHSAEIKIDFATMVVENLAKGKLVIVDQSTGDPRQNERAAERIMWRVFNTQQDKFRSAAATGGMDSISNHILVYVEEAHNLLPRGSSADILRTVWARAAKEGSKMNLGMILATQAPSSIMPEILSETDNWILAYLNSARERRVVGDYMDFEDFLEQIGQVSEPGFVRIRTLSRAYTVPMQFRRFRLEL